MFLTTATLWDTLQEISDAKLTEKRPKHQHFQITFKYVNSPPYWILNYTRTQSSHAQCACFTCKTTVKLSNQILSFEMEIDQ